MVGFRSPGLAKTILQTRYCEGSKESKDEINVPIALSAFRDKEQGEEASLIYASPDHSEETEAESSRLRTCLPITRPGKDRLARHCEGSQTKGKTG